MNAVITSPATAAQPPRHAASAPGWSRASWRGQRLLQQPTYPDPVALERTAAELAALPGLVAAGDIVALRERLAEAARGHRFVLHGGECAELFERCLARPIARTARLLGDLATILRTAGGPVTTVARLAGQYAKPRSAAAEERDGAVLPSYRGDLVNGRSFSAAARTPQPERLLEAYRRAATTLAVIRRVTASWPEPLAVCHEGLHLHYEAALTRSVGGATFDLSTHLPWIGLRTAYPDAAQVELLRGVANPLAVKVGPDMDAARLLRLAARLDPRREPGRLTLVTRFGADRVERCLPPLVAAMRAAGHPVLWLSDPMHGNTESTASGRKTRRFERVWQEVAHTFAGHREAGSRLGGLHLELTGDEVTECTGGAAGLTDADLGRRYESAVDPRLNRSQAIELVRRVATLLAGDASGRVLPFARHLSA